MFQFIRLSRQNVYKKLVIYRHFYAESQAKRNIEQVLLIQSSGYQHRCAIMILQYRYLVEMHST